VLKSPGRAFNKISVLEEAVVLALRKMDIDRCSMSDEPKWAFLLKAKILDWKTAWTEVFDTFLSYL
jgi:hypothetical protein